MRTLYRGFFALVLSSGIILGIPIANNGQLLPMQQSDSTSGMQSFGAATNPPNFGDSRFKQSATGGTNVQKTAAFDQMVQDAQPPQQAAQASSVGTITSDKVPAAVDPSVGYDTVANCPPPQVCVGPAPSNLFTPIIIGGGAAVSKADLQPPLVVATPPAVAAMNANMMPGTMAPVLPPDPNVIYQDQLFGPVAGRRRRRFRGSTTDEDAELNHALVRVLGQLNRLSGVGNQALREQVTRLESELNDTGAGVEGLLGASGALGTGGGLGR